jgi:hypothetical protein
VSRSPALAPAAFRARYLSRALELGPARSTAWTAATIIGLAIGGFVFHFPGSISASWDVGALIFGTLFGGVTGLMVGVLQALALRGVVAGLGRQVWTMGVIVGATHGAYDGSRYVGAPLEIGAGIVAAGAVWLLLGERRASVLAGVAVGWALGLMIAARTTSSLGMPWSETPVGWSTEHMVAGVVTGAIFAAAVVIAGLPGLERRPAGGGA